MRNHFERMAALSTRVRAICGRSLLPESALSLVAPTNDGLILTVPGEILDPGDIVAVSYTLDSYLYTFEAEVLRVIPDREHSVTLVIMSLPDRVARVERRRSPRVACNPRESVAVRFCLPNGACFEGAAIDISVRGAGLGIPGIPVSFNPGDSLSTLIALPRLGELCLETVVKTMTRIPEGLRVGIEFLKATEEETDLVRQYVHLRQIQTNRERAAIDAPGFPRESIFVVAGKGPSGSRQFILCSDAFLGHLADPDAFSEIASVDVIDYIKKG